MNIHLIANEKFTNRFIDLIDRKFEPGSNIIYIYKDESEFRCKDADCARFINEFSEIDLSLLGDEGKFFVHAFYNTAVIRYLFKVYRKFHKNQLVLIAWGADIYDSRYRLEDHGIHVRTRIYEYIKKCIIRRCNIFMTFACADMEIIQNYYDGQGKQFDCLYPSNVDIDLLDKLKNEVLPADNNTVRILLGNSATETNKHIEAINLLAHFSQEDIEILCPLSYGDKEYRQRVIEAGKKTFGEKFIPVLEYLTPEDYSKMLSSVSVAVFNHNRQQGTGNIEILAYLGKKIFLRSDITTWKHYVVRDQCIFFDVKEISNMSFTEFVTMSQNDISLNIKYFKNIWDIDYVKSLWDKVIAYTG